MRLSHPNGCVCVNWRHRTSPECDAVFLFDHSKILNQCGASIGTEPERLCFVNVGIIAMQTEEFRTLLSYVNATFFSFLTMPTDDEGALSAGNQNPITAIYDEDTGLIVARSVLREDGLVQEDSYMDGVRSATKLLDVGNFFDWADVTNIFDESGRVRKETTLDNGLLRVDTFQDGVRLRAYQSDPDDIDLVDWTTRGVTYDFAGTPLSRLTRYDDGTERLESFQDGVRAEVVQADLVLNAQIWTQIAASFDSIGRLTGRELTYDSGLLREDSFSAGVRQKTNLEDAEDAFDWKTIQYLYDRDGVIQSKQEVGDNGDLTLILFANGQRTERAILNADGTAEWGVQITTYDATGVSDVTEYGDRGSVLDDYGAFFGSDDLVFAAA
jgi:hypothetical protein